MTEPPRPPASQDDAVPGLRVGFVPGVTVTKWRRIWADRFRRIDLVVVEVAQSAQRGALADGRVDMCFVRLPLAQDGLHVIPLYEEVPVVVVGKDHPVSLFDEVTMADLSDETVLAGVDPDKAIDLVAGGAGVLLVPHSIARSHSRRDLVYRPISDGTPTQIGLAWLTDNPHEMIEEFIGIVRGRTVNSSRSPRTAATAPATPPPARRRRTAPPKSRSKSMTRRGGRRGLR
jgi:DNA-binding transcriptional LysR family regulator